MNLGNFSVSLAVKGSFSMARQPDTSSPSGPSGCSIATSESKRSLQKITSVDPFLGHGRVCEQLLAALRFKAAVRWR
jgi:hypothetical protein